MEFSDPIVSQAESLKSDKEPASDAGQSSTEKQINSLEQEIDQLYGTVETKFQQLWLSASKEAGVLSEKYQLDERKQELLDQLANLRNNPTIAENLAVVEQQLSKLNIDTSELQTKVKESYNSLDLGAKAENALKSVEQLDLKTTANNALDSLDSQLEKVENAAVGYVSSFASFFSSVILVAPATPEEAPSKETIFSSPLKYGTTRYEQDLYKLHSEEAGYFVEDSDEDLASFKVDDKTEEIAALLQEYPQLNTLMNSLVPVKLTYATFWYRYFKQQAKIEEEDLKRKQLKSEQAGDEEEFNWDDDEEEDSKEVSEKTEKKDEKKEAPAKKEATETSSKASAVKTESKGEEEEDDDEDDWA